MKKVILASIITAIILIVSAALSSCVWVKGEYYHADVMQDGSTFISTLTFNVDRWHLTTYAGEFSGGVIKDTTGMYLLYETDEGGTKHTRYRMFYNDDKNPVIDDKDPFSTELTGVEYYKTEDEARENKTISEAYKDAPTILVAKVDIPKGTEINAEN